MERTTQRIADHGALDRTGAAIPELEITPDHAQVFMFSAATWNRHHIHYSKDAAVAEGLPDVVVQRALIGNFLARLLTRWLGGRGEIRELSWKVTGSAVPGTPLRCGGRVVDSERAGAVGPVRIVRCELSVIDESGRPIASGRARIRLTERRIEGE